MPFYRYVCKNCGHEKVIMHSMNESPNVVCDVCGAPMKKAVGRVGIVFKGSGFYITDSRKGNGKSSNSGNSETKKEEKKAS